jgi:predicted transcriptional regulator
LKRNLTQDQLGNWAGVHRVIVSRIETGAMSPNRSTRQKLESVLGRVDWLETASIKTKSPDYHAAQKLVEQLVATTATMDKDEKKAIKKLIHKYYS